MIKGFIKSLIGDASTIIDDVVTSKEEKMALRNAMKKMLLESEVELQKNVTERWKADMNSDSWLSKNIRPLTLAFLLISTVLLIFIDAGFINFEVKNSWVDLLQLVMISVVGAYFGGRSLEKIKK
tara:strand:- start:1517 stop:1891 length:375 start_codon:yes stop_codon:yes gene_type:complete